MAKAENQKVVTSQQAASSREILVSSTGLVDGKDLFVQLHQRAVSMGLHHEHFAQMPNLRRIREDKKSEKLSQFAKWTVIVAVIVSSILVSWGTDFPFSRPSLARLWVRIRGDNSKSTVLERERCLIRASNAMQDLARPPIGCDFCTNISEVMKVRDLSQHDFREMFAYSGQPVVITDGAANWSALDVFSYGFFKDLYHPGSTGLKNTESHCQFFPYKTEFKRLGEVFTMNERRALMETHTTPWYIGWSNCDAAAGKVLRSHYTRPYFLPAESESSKTDWIFMGSPGYGAHMHVDHVKLPSWQAQIAGHKRWTLHAPPECYNVCGDHSVIVHPGEIIVLDTNKWYHSTLILGEDISITIGSEFD